MGVSLIITTYGRAAQLDRSLRRLAELTPPDEVIVVDDGTETRAVHGVCENLSDRLNIRYFYNNRPGWNNPCQPRNAALKLATYDEIITSEPELLFLTDVVAQFEEARKDHTNTVLTEEFCWHEPHEGASLDECNSVPAFYVNSFRKDWLMEIGGWDEGLPQDWGWDDLLTFSRLEHIGHPRQTIEGVVVRHQWHPSRICPSVENEAYVKSMKFPRDLVANQNRVWGQLV